MSIDREKFQTNGIIVALIGVGVIVGCATVAALVLLFVRPLQPPAPAPSPPGQPPFMVKAATGAELTDPEPGVFAAVIDSPPPGVSFGFEPNQQAVAALLESGLTSRVFGATPAGMTEEIPRSAYLWQAHEGLLGRPPPEKDQNPVGACVGFGTTTAIERTLACEIYSRFNVGAGDPSEFTHFCEEVTYAGARVEVNGGKSPIQPSRRDPDGDGANGSWAAKWAMQFGMLPRGNYPPDFDLMAYKPATARAWQFKGVPDVLEPECAKYKVADASLIRNWTDAKKALANGYGIAVCSDVGVNAQRDANGVAKAGPAWSHCMCLDGYHTDEQGREYGHFDNSWAKTNYHKGPVGWGKPTNAGFWLAAKDVQRMLAQGESWAFSGAKGFPKLEDPFWIQVPILPSRNVAARPVAPFALFGGVECSLAH